MFTKEMFLQRAQSVHGAVYDYSDTNYVGARKDVFIKCRIHGVFSQRACDHMSGAGCPKCRKRQAPATVECFIKKARAIHGKRYSFASTKYINSRTKVEITCKSHGVFKQTPAAHIQGAGCPKCRPDGAWSTKKFVQHAKSVHGVKFDYSQTLYENSRTVVSVRCKAHGTFSVNPERHLKGVGCQLCRTALLQSEFITLAKSIHGRKYSYGKVNYANRFKEVIITCKKHGDFQKKPLAIINGPGCKQCVLDKKQKK